MTQHAEQTVDQRDARLVRRFGAHIVRFLHTESASGMLLVVAAVLAMTLKNSPLSDAYIAFLNIEGEIRVGALALEKPLFLWVNDGLMAVFFFMIGLEIKREFLHGYLSDHSRLVLPALGAVGGVAVPALIYLAITAGDPQAMVGWAVPTATDIAFALGVLALLGTRIPGSLKIFLMTLAILDDLIAIIVIALFYTSGLSVISLTFAAGFLALLFLLTRFRVRRIAAYVLVGIALWVCVLKSGVHATLAGVVTAFFIPSDRPLPDEESPLDTMITALHPWVAFGTLPLFAFVNAGVSLQGLHPSMLLEPIPLGISLGLLIGKPVGVMLFAGGAILFGLAKMPDRVGWMHFLGVGFLCGIGFTMSLFIAGLAFAESGTSYARIDRLGLLVGSVACAIIGYIILRLTPRRSS